VGSGSTGRLLRVQFDPVEYRRQEVLEGSLVIKLHFLGLVAEHRADLRLGGVRQYLRCYVLLLPIDDLSFLPHPLWSVLRENQQADELAYSVSPANRPPDQLMNTIRDALVITAVGAAATWLFGRPVLRAWKGRSWPQTRGTVTDSRIENPSFGTTERRKRVPLHVSYRYAVGGETYTSDRASFFSKAIIIYGYEHTNEVRRHFTKGTEVDVRYDPRNPSDAVIDGKIPWERGAAAGFSAFFFVAGMIGLVRILLH